MIADPRRAAHIKGEVGAGGTNAQGRYRALLAHLQKPDLIYSLLATGSSATSCYTALAASSPPPSSPWRAQALRPMEEEKT
uniref:Uncharacterized protein n=1 Tax=Setaria viridis TaxID=4556 RepID=A0A4U6V3Z1_SETVI|nr:hypothetical protein SEVIR_5G431900v2 [Setaria viridis]